MLVDRFDLAPPVDLGRLAEAFADVETDAIPGRCDGLVVGLHGPRPRPLILLRDDGPPRRQRFTLAHELGHIVLAWHLGDSYACNTRRGFDEESFRVVADEGEANRFAAHLLVPSRWLDQQRAAHCDDAAQLMAAMSDAQVSAHVACLRLNATLPAGRMFAVLDDERRVVLSGQTPGTGLEPPRSGESLKSDHLDRFAMHMEEVRFASRPVIWWTFRGTGDMEDASDDGRSSREILEDLLGRHLAPVDAEKVQMSLSGVIGSANSDARREGATERGVLYARFRGRFAKGRAYPDALLADPEFERWIQARAKELGT